MIVNEQTIGATVFAGAVCWLATLILVEGVIFQGCREWLKVKCDRIRERCLDRDNEVRGTWMARNAHAAAGKIGYLVTCHLCAGTWVGIALTPFAHGPFHSTIFGVTALLNGLLYKAMGHLFLEIQAVLMTRSAWQKAQADAQRHENRRQRELEQRLSGQNTELPASAGAARS